MMNAATMMNAARSIGALCLVLAAGCAGTGTAPPAAITQTGPIAVDPTPAGPSQDQAVAAEPPRTEAIQKAVAVPLPPAEPPRTEAIQKAVAVAPPPVTLGQPMMSGNKAVENEPVAAAPAPPSNRQSATKSAPPSKTQSTANATQPAAKAPARVSASAVTIEQPLRHEEPAPVAKMLEPPLDIATLKSRLRDTDAIGVFTKLALKNQVDDLLQQFRAHYLNGQQTNVATLRQPYDMLVLKVLALLQDGDPSLARTISASRDAIWRILADREKFNSAS